MLYCFRYIGEEVQPTNFAIDNHKFTNVTSGKKQKSLKGNATPICNLNPHIQAINKFDPSTNTNVSTEICSSKQKQFSLITFIDTPGLGNF